MKIHEYQAKQIFARYGVPVPRGEPGVKVAKGGAAEARTLAENILGMQLVTKQTGPEGQKVRRLYVEQGLDIAREIYLALLVDRDRRRIALMASTEGGMDIEAVA